MSQNTKRRLLAVVMLVLLSTACNAAPPPKQDIGAAKQRWQQLGITDYRLRLRMTLSAHSNLGDELIITVRNNESFGYECISGTCALFGTGVSFKYNLTANDLFYMAEHNIMDTAARGDVVQDCLQVKFNTEYGLPEQIDNKSCADLNAQSVRAGLIELLSFEVLPPSPTPKAFESKLPNDWDRRWLNGTPCQPPCWEGVTPGVSTVTDTIKALQLSPLISEVQLRSDFDGNWGAIDWYWISGQEGGSVGFQPQNSNSVVVDIHPNIDRIPLSEVIAAFGKPQSVIASALRNPHNDGVSYALLVIYLPQGVVLSNFSLAKPTLSNDTQLDVRFIEPTEETLSKEIGGMANFPKWRVPWQGVHDFDFYCQDLDNGAVCNNQ